MIFGGEQKGGGGESNFQRVGANRGGNYDSKIVTETYLEPVVIVVKLIVKTCEYVVRIH